MYVQPCEHRGLHLLAGKRCLEHWKTLPIVSAATNHVQARRGGAKLSCFHSLWPTGCHINVALLWRQPESAGTGFAAAMPSRRCQSGCHRSLAATALESRSFRTLW